MFDVLSVVERGLKAVRYGIFQASDNLATLLDGLCRAPEPYVDATEHLNPDYEKPYCGSAHPSEVGVTCLKPLGHIFSHQNYGRFWPLDSAASPQVAVVAPSPKGSDSGSEEIAPIWRRPSEPHPDFRPDGLLQRARLLRILMDVSGAHDGYTVDMEDWNCVCGALLDTEYFRPNEAHRRHVAQQQSTAVIEAHQQK